MGSRAADFERARDLREDGDRMEGTQDTRQDDQSELGLAISKAVTQVLESSDWRALSFPLEANSGKNSKAKNAVKRPMNPFMLYAQAARKKLSHLYPDLSYAKLSKTLGRIWKSLDQAEKQPFIDEAERLRQKHKIDHPDYKFQPKRREKKRAHSPNKESFENGKISTGDVLKVLSSSGNVNKHHESQNLWAQTIHGSISPSLAPFSQQKGLPQHVGNQKLSPPAPYSVDRSSPDRGRSTTSPSPLIGKMNSGVFDPQQLPTTSSTNDFGGFSSRFITPPPPLQRATTASLFSPTSYRLPKTQATYSQLNDFHSYSSAMQNYPTDLSLAIGNSFLKCSPQITRPPHLSSNEDLSQSSNLLTGVNQILRDMFGTDKNNVL